MIALWLALIAGAPAAAAGGAKTPRPTLETRLLESPLADALALQLFGGRYRTMAGGLEPAWQYDLGIGYARFWRLRPPSPHQVGFRAALSFPDLRGIEIWPALEYRWGTTSTLNLAWGPLWRIDGALVGAGGHRGELSLLFARYGWVLYFAASHAIFGRPQLDFAFGARFEILAFRKGRARARP